MVIVKTEIDNNYEINTPEEFIDEYEMLQMSGSNYESVLFLRYIDRVFGTSEGDGTKSRTEAKRRCLQGLKILGRDMGLTYEQIKTEAAMQQLRYDAVAEVISSIRTECFKTMKLAEGCKNTIQLTYAIAAMKELKKKKHVVDLDVANHTDILPSPDQTPF